MKRIFFFVLEIVKIVIIALVIVVPIRYFVFQPFFVVGQSMEPNFYQGDYLIVDEVSYRFNDPQRGDVVIFNYPNNPSQRFIKRIIGLPGETIEIKDKKIFIRKDGQEKILDESVYLFKYANTPSSPPLPLGQNEYFVLGDNRVHSFDSEDWGALPGENIIGKVALKAWPFTVLAKIENPDY